MGEVGGGLVVVLEPAASADLVALARGGSRLVHALAASDDAVARHRTAIAAEKLAGLASVERATSLTRLPYADELVNTMIADLDTLGDRAPAREELLRVLVPTGTLLLKRGGSWTKAAKPPHDDVDEWTTWDYDASGNPASQDLRVGPTTSLRWYAGPSTSDNGADKVGLRIADGRVFYMLRDYEYLNRDRRGARRDIVSRDAYNGLLLWKRPFEDVPGRGDNPARFALTAIDQQVFTILEDGGPLVSLEAATGQKQRQYDVAMPPKAAINRRYWDSDASELHFVTRVVDGQLLHAYRDTIYLVEADTGKRVWTHTVGKDQRVFWVVAGGGKIFAAVSAQPLAKARSSPACAIREVIALDQKTGAVAWRNGDFGERLMYRMLYHDGRVIVPHFQAEKPGNISYAGKYHVTSLDAATGRTQWINDEGHQAHGHYQVALVRGDRVYVGQQRGFSLELASGKLVAKHDWGQYDGGCSDLRCVPGYVFYGLTYIDDDDQKITRGQARSRCDVGVFPAYGMMYAGPSGCLCSNFVNGYLALASEKPLAPVADAARLTKGPAFVEVQATPRATDWPAHDEWPIHRASAQRGCASASSIPTQPEITWQRALAERPAGILGDDWRDNEQIVGALTAATAAAGKVFVAATDEHRIVALEAKTGEPAWSFTAGGRIDSPPTIYRGLCLFGARDGYVYALLASDGALAWRFLAAPSDKRIVVASQLESAWPVHGSVLIHNDAVVFTAGRQSALDGGIQLYSLDPLSGKLQWKSRIWTDPDVDQATEPRSNSYQPDYRRTQSLLVRDGRQLRHTIDPLAERYADGELPKLLGVTAADRGGWVTSTRTQQFPAREITCLWANSSGFLSRRLEGVGRNDFSGLAYSNLIAAHLVLADRRIYGLFRGGYGMKQPGLAAFDLDADRRPVDAPAWISPENTSGNHYLAVVLAGDKLLLAGHRQYAEGDFLQIFSATDGQKLHELPLPARPVRDGLAIAGGRIFVACEDGQLFALGGK